MVITEYDKYGFSTMSSAPLEFAKEAKSWPFEEAKKVLQRVQNEVPEKGYVLFETGYGPSGLPHIGTFGEVARTSMVREAFKAIAPHIPTKLICFSDDMDGLRKVPGNVPRQEELAKYLNMPLTQVPDPYNAASSFGEANNNRLKAFLDQFGFDYEFLSSTDVYKSGTFDQALLTLLERYDDVMAVMLPTLGAERQATYSPFLPISPTTGHVLQVPVVERKLDSGTIVFEDPATSRLTEVPVTGGACKLQWKPDWAMRWHALGVDYEMSGKDLIDSVKVGARITKILGSRAPDGFNYELFLDEQGQKISKSKGNGVSIDEFLRYAPEEALSYFMWQRPRAAKKLWFDVIPKAVEDYLQFQSKYVNDEGAKRLDNPLWAIHGEGRVPARDSSLSYGLLMNLASVVNAEIPDVLWGFIERYEPGASPETAPFLNKLVGRAMAYYQDFVKPNKKYRQPNETEVQSLRALRALLAEMPANTPADDIQTAVFTVGKEAAYENLRDWFKALYEILLGQEQGPRMGSFFSLYGLNGSVALIDDAIAGQLGN